jgi:hypothetical protein
MPRARNRLRRQDLAECANIVGRQRNGNRADILFKVLDPLCSRNWDHFVRLSENPRDGDLPQRAAIMGSQILIFSSN